MSALDDLACMAGIPFEKGKGRGYLQGNVRDVTRAVHYTGGLTYQRGTKTIVKEPGYKACGLLGAGSRTRDGVTCKRCLLLMDRADNEPKRLIVTWADARKELLSQAAAFLNHWECTTYEGSRVREGDDETGDAWAMLNAERQRLAERLHKESGMPGGISGWDPDL